MRVLMSVLFLALVTVACGQEGKSGYTSDEFIKLQKEKKEVVLLDVRTPPELTGDLGKIDGVINIPLQELNTRMDELTEYKDKEIVVICRSGRRSGIATEILKKEGYDAVNLEGGMLGYRNADKK